MNRLVLRRLLRRHAPAAVAAFALTVALTLGCLKRADLSDAPATKQGAGGLNSGAGSKASVALPQGYLAADGVPSVALSSVATPPPAFDTIDPQLVMPTQPENVVLTTPPSADPQE